jgi:hypothetical protein
MLDLGEKLIKAGVLYADDTPVDQMREVRSASENESIAWHVFCKVQLLKRLWYWPNVLYQK